MKLAELLFSGFNISCVRSFFVVKDAKMLHFPVPPDAGDIPFSMVWVNRYTFKTRCVCRLTPAVSGVLPAAAQT
jgi:hypothetical protein